MSTNNLNDLSDEFKKTINDALESGNFSNLNKLVTSTVDYVIDETKNQTQSVVDNISKEITKNINVTASKGNKSIRFDTTYYKEAVPEPVEYRKSNNTALTVSGYKMNKVGKVQGILLSIFGGIGMGLTVLSTLLAVIYMLYIDSFSIGKFWISLVFFLVFSNIIDSGKEKLKRVKRAERYVKIAGNKGFVFIEELASRLGQNKKSTLKEVKKILSLGMFPEGHLDEKETCLILTDEIYDVHADTQKSQQEKETVNAKESGIQSDNQELQDMIKEGNDYIKKLRELNDLIEGEVISTKLYKLENLLKDIFQQVKKYPEKMPNMHKLMNYYLPTTIKMVRAYAEFDAVEGAGSDIIQAKDEIEHTIDTINEAFQELLNKLFLDQVYDVTTDAQVLKTLLSREGLVKDGLDKVKE